MKYNSFYNAFVNSKYTYSTRESHSFYQDSYFSKALHDAIWEWFNNKDNGTKWKYSPEVSLPHNIEEAELLRLLNTIE